MAKKLSNEIVDERLINRNIKRLDNYINSNIKIRWECLVDCCHNIWEAKPDNILNTKTNCPKCDRLTNEKIDERLKNRPIKRIGDVIDSITKIEWQCKINDCNYCWKTTPSTILYRNRGCPKCGKNARLTNEIVDERLKERNVRRKENIINSNFKIEWECLNCFYNWKTTPAHILGGSDCPKCSNKMPLTNENVDEYLKNRLVKRIGNIINNDIKIDWQCLIKNCNNIWSARPANILFGGGCPNCRYKNEKNIANLLNINNIIYYRNKDIRTLDAKEKRCCRVDFYFPEHNLIIEYNGHQHYGPRCFGGISEEIAQINFINQQERDAYVRNFCKTNNIELLEIDGRKYKYNILTDYIIKLIDEKLKRN